VHPDIWKADADRYYHAHGRDVDPNRPHFQGDVFEDLPLPLLPIDPPDKEVATRYEPQLAILIPHPCQSHKGDALKEHLTVAPVTLKAPGEFLSGDWSQPYARFPLPDLVGTDLYWADLNRLVSIPCGWIESSKRIACLSHLGVALLNKRLMMFQSRVPVPVDNLMAELMEQWVEADVCTEWRRITGTPKGFDKYMKTEKLIAGLEQAPRRLLIGRPEVIVDDISESYGSG
jgi:hypothetical protein